MLHTIDEDIELCQEFKLTPSQLMFLKMLVRDPAYDEAEWRKKSRKLREAYQKYVGGITPEELADLVSREIVIDDNDLGSTILTFYEISPKFAMRFELKVHPMAFDLVDAYPARFKGSNGQWFIGVTSSAEELAKDYLRAINNDPEEHKRVMNDLEWAKKNNGVIMGVKKFVLTKYWRVIRETRSKNSNKASDVTIV